ncbi:MAG: hypothetical protein CTY35_00500 [Methylotenera sp.]|uniref:hypothetical protein n=1 Tax=Methylotenera sp. TaxID=2051956 RepID=UPI000D45D59B|nr:hypothetical protein [Methylotenera sp.]PPC84835.1 MAG: hypothetical protein CTY38_00495 [Methylotenera sp.]PPD02195.1 MAG: hypothetical protein CTY35_00500 [Methylotenera sp.]
MQERNVLSDYGFMSTGDIPHAVEASIVKASSNIAEAIGIEPSEVGFGIRIVFGNERSLLKLNDDMNLVDLEVPNAFSESVFSYGWALALHYFNLIENSGEAINSLLHHEISAAEASKRITVRWKNTEISIQNTLDSIFSQAEDPMLASAAIKAFHGSVDGMMVATTDQAIVAMKKLQADANELDCPFDSDHSNLLVSLLDMRSDCAYDIQKVSALNGGTIKSPIAYYARMTDLSAIEGDDEILNNAPAVAIASYLAQKSNVKMDHKDKRCLPTPDELSEIESRIPAFSSILNTKLAFKSKPNISF